ncbi:MAG: twin-arginine translocase subunit TatC [Gemmatimonadota bacterium]|jgi:sec-independent protein translocase protein TatC|nr:twin-arginine translocase subunit TatC [Gemmatimonadota bacterium]MDP6801795.1 twin-arginine translocase subunit TatC [Gemmatimonadota bacterium]
MAPDDAPRKPAAEAGGGPGEMTLVEHLEDLRKVLFQSAAILALVSVGTWFVSERALEILIRPAVQFGGSDRLVFLSPTGAFLMRLKMSVGLGVLLAAPVLMERLWSFVVPGLLRKERRFLLPVVATSVVLFYLGVAFAYFVILPVSMSFLVGFGTEHLQAMISGENYFAFAVRLAVAFGGVFQFPLVVTLLTLWGVMDPGFLKKYWRYGVVVVFAMSAMITPPDVASQLLMAGPVLLLYGISMGIAAMIARNRGRARDEEKKQD